MTLLLLCPRDNDHNFISIIFNPAFPNDRKRGHKKHERAVWYSNASTRGPEASTWKARVDSGLLAGRKAAIARGVLVFVSFAAIVGEVWRHLRPKKRRFHEFEDTSIPGRRFPLSLLAGILSKHTRSSAVYSFELPNGAQSTYQDVQRHEMGVTSTPSIASKRAPVREVGLSGDWNPAKIDGRERKDRQEM
jgi:hypothetical protein